ncbi:TPA: hypothetical protein ACH3X2_006720 [Trebouxia sp. C0005]
MHSLAPAAAAPAKKATKPKLGCREKQELERLPAEIDALSVTKASLEQQLAMLTQQRGDGHQQAAQIGLQLAKLPADVDAKTDRWLDLEEQAEQ